MKNESSYWVSGRFYIDTRLYPQFDGMAVGKTLNVRVTSEAGERAYAEAKVIAVDANGFTGEIVPE